MPLIKEITVRHHTLLDNCRIVGVVDVDVTVDGINGCGLRGCQRLVGNTRLGFKLQCDRGIAAGEIHRERATKGRDSGVFAAGTVLPECAGIASGFQFVADIVGIAGHQHIHISSGNGQNAA